jgi:predicted GNAT family acetyltransferase
VYTHPSYRGRGLGRSVTAGVVARLGDRADVVGLNVHADNAPARRIYDSIGFTPIHAYDEAQLT